MNHLPPPPPHGAPYAPPPPPPPPVGTQPHHYHQYPPQGSYQQPHQPLPLPAQYGGIQYQDGYPQGHASSPSRGAGPTQGLQERPNKSKMIITRYVRPPSHAPPSYAGQPPYSGNQYPGYPQPPPPPANQAAYPPSNWAPQQPYAPPPAGYGPPLPPPPANNYHPPQQYASPVAPQPPIPYAGYGQQPPQAYPLPPPPQAHPAQQYPPPPANTSNPAWTNPQPQPQYPPQPAWSPPPASVGPQAPPPSIHVDLHTNVPAAYSEPLASLPTKDRNDPTFYDGWDEGEFEYAAALWPAKGEIVDESLSLGQYIWRAPALITFAIPPNVDDEVPLATAAQKYDPHKHFIVSKYYETESAEGHEYVYNFQRIRYIEEWSERKTDPLFKIFSDTELHEDVIPADLVIEQVLNRADEALKVDWVKKIDEAIAPYLATSAPSKSKKNTEAESILAALGVTGAPKTVYSTPFPAYNPPSEDQEAERTPQRTSSTNSVPQQRTFPAPPPVEIAPPFTARRVRPPRVNTYTDQVSPPPPMHPLPAPPSHQFPPPPHAHGGHYPPPQTVYSQAYPAPPPPSTAGNYHQSPRAHGSHHSHQSRALTPSIHMRSPPQDPWQDPWRVGTAGRRETPPTSARAGTPAGSDFGDFSTNGPGSATGTQHSPAHSPYGPHAPKKRKVDEPDAPQRKRSKPKVQVNSAYQRRW